MFPAFLDFVRAARRAVHVAPLVALAALVTTARSPAQCAEGWLPGKPVPGVNGSVGSVVMLPGGDALLGGAFSTAGDLPVNRLARYNPNADVWSAVGSGVVSVGIGLPDASVGPMVALAGGDVLIGGQFTSAGGIPTNNAARYNPSTGAWSAVGGLQQGSRVRALAALPGGDFLIGGELLTVDGLPEANSLLRCNPNTGVWSVLELGIDTNMFPGASTSVTALTTLPGGDVLVCGRFTSAGGAGGILANNIVRYNPSTGGWSALGSGTAGSVGAAAILPGGDFIVGGSFATAGNVPANNIARYSPSTGLWSALGGGGLVGSPTGLAILADGDVLVGGDVAAAGGVPVYGLARYRPSTGAWSAVGLRAGTNGVGTLAVMPGGDVLVCGFVLVTPDVRTVGVARYNPTNGAWSTLGLGVSSAVRALSAVPGGDVLVGGYFTTAGAAAGTNYVARYNPTSGSWSGLGGGVGGIQPGVLALAVLPGGDFLVGGTFETAGLAGLAANNIARFSPATGVWSALGASAGGGVRMASASPSVQAVAPLPDGDLLVGGVFSLAGEVGVQNLARYSPGTGAWSNPGFVTTGSGTGVASVNAMLVLPGGDVLVGGNFTSIGGVTARRLARYNPSTGAWSSPGSGIGSVSAVNALALLPDGDVVVGGTFSTVGGLNLSASRVARCNLATGVWSALGSGVSGTSAGAGGASVVRAITVLPGGDDVVVGGNFAAAGDAPASRVARYNISAGAWLPLGSGAGNSSADVYSLAWVAGGDVIAGGNFARVGGQTSANFGRYSLGNPPPVVDAQPLPNIACPTGSASFSVTAGGQGPLTYQWQVRAAAAPNEPWRTLGNDPGPLPCGGGAFAYASPLNSPTVNIGIRPCPSATPGAAQHFQVRCVVTNSCGSVTSTEAAATTCPADFNCTGGQPTVQDIFDFLGAFFTADVRADFNGTGGLPSVQDVFDFLGAYFAGC